MKSSLGKYEANNVNKNLIKIRCKTIILVFVKAYARYQSEREMI
jgi:hypothetical protein